MKIELPAYSRLHRHVRSEPPQAVQIPLGHITGTWSQIKQTMEKRY